jgi:hypothetical protein
MHDEIEKKFHIDDSWVDMWTFYILGAQVYQLRQGNFKSLEEKFTITSQVIKIKPCGHHEKLFNKKQKKNLEDVNLMKYNLQISNIHD